MNRPWMPPYVGDYLGDTGHLILQTRAAPGDSVKRVSEKPAIAGGPDLAAFIPVPARE